MEYLEMEPQASLKLHVFVVCEWSRNNFHRRQKHVLTIHRIFILNRKHGFVVCECSSTRSPDIKFLKPKSLLKAQYSWPFKQHELEFIQLPAINPMIPLEPELISTWLF